MMMMMMKDTSADTQEVTRFRDEKTSGEIRCCRGSVLSGAVLILFVDSSLAWGSWVVDRGAGAHLIPMDLRKRRRQ